MLSLDDFLPTYIRKALKKSNPEKSEAALKAKLMALAKRSKPDG